MSLRLAFRFLSLGLPSVGVAKVRRRTACCLALCVVALGCRGKVSSKPPRLFVHDMYDQAPLRPQARDQNAPSGAAARALPRGVVAREAVVELGPHELGKSKSGYLSRVPLIVDEALLSRGEQRFNVYCSVCHDRMGSGQGATPQRGFPGPVDLASESTRAMKDGQIFEIITQGIRNMPPMADQVPVPDRWPIVAWVRVLQRSQYAKVSDVEPGLVSSIKPEEVN